MNGYDRLRSADPTAWVRAGAAWRAVGALVERRADGLAARTGDLRDAWAGRAATAAGDRLTVLRAELRSAAPLPTEVDQILTEFAARLRQASARLAGVISRAHTAGLRVDQQGRIGVPAARPAPTPGTGPVGDAWPASPAVEAARLSTEVSAALALAEAADREASARLGELSTAARTGWVTPPPAYRPPPGAEPALVQQWWSGLTPAQRRWLVLHEPTRIGCLDGVPATARDQANRLLLDAYREQLLAWRRTLAGRLPPGPTGLGRLDTTLAALDALADRLTGSDAADQPRAYLLGLDPTGDGRAVVAVGNPDRADRVLTYVPGMTADLADAGNELDRAARVAARVTALDPGGQTSAVLWLDYDAPDFVHEAYRARPAEDASVGLHRFQEGLRVTHDGPPARQTVIGHSYGSLVVGTAARVHGLAADALVFVGSPGVGVDHVTELRLPGGQVWASTAANDVIGLVRPPDELTRRATTGAVLPLLAPGLFGRPDDQLWFGRDPTDPGFGARVFDSGRYGHTGYWDPGNPALDGMARIVLGR